MKSHSAQLRLAYLLFLLSLLAPQTSLGFQRRTGLELLLQKYEIRRESFESEMEQIASFCAENSFLSDADRIRKRAKTIELTSQELDNLPTHVLPELPKNLDPIEERWRVKLAHVQREYAKDLYKFSRQAIREQNASLAFDLIRRCVYYDPDHQQGRMLLGFVKDDDQWVTPFVRSMKGLVDDPKYGWLPEEHVIKYQNGQRLFEGRWISAEREQIERSDFRKAWEIETEHFEIRTNYSLERGVELGRRLETFYRFFKREYADFFNTPQKIEALLSSKPTRSKPHRIHYYRSKDEFVRVLESSQPGIEQANGFYWPRQRTAYFFHVDDPEAADLNIETMYHEVAHQLLSESGRVQFDVGELAHFWVIEGFACYLESFEVDDDGSVRIGDPKHPRIYWAKQKALDEEFFVPMQRFTAYGRRQFMTDADAETKHAYYSQATGMCHFLLHFNDGQYRDKFVEYLTLVYSPNSRSRNRTKSLAQVLEVPFATLDRQYLEYLQTLK